MHQEILAGLLKRRSLIVAGGVVIVAAAIGLSYMRAKTSDARKGPPPVPVTIAHVTRRDVPITLEGLGTVQAFNSVTLKVRVDGTLDTVSFVEGQNVKAGEVLAQIDPRPYRAALDAAVAKKAQDESQLPMARRDLERFETLVQKNFATEQNVEHQHALIAQLEASVKADEAAIESAQINLGFTTIRAPIDGRIGLRQVDVGNVVHAIDTVGLAVISQLHPIAVVFTLPADDVPAITQAMHGGTLPVEVHRYDETRKLADGELLTLDSTIDQSTGTIKLKATSSNDDDALWPGESVRAHLLLRTERQALTIPEPAVQRGPNGLFVYVVNADMTVKVQPIETMDVGEGIVVVTRGLADSDVVVLSGHSRLRPGAMIKPLDRQHDADVGREPKA